MKIIKPGYERIEEKNITKKIERIARICYKSEDKITDGTDLKMVNALIKRQHTAMLEHGDVALIVDRSDYKYLIQLQETMETCCTDRDNIPKNCHLRFTYTSIAYGAVAVNEDSHRYIVSGNVRAWYNLLAFIKDKGWGIQETVFTVLNCAVNYIFDCFSDIVGVTSGYEHFFKRGHSYARAVTDYSELTDAERMVHETFSVLFTVDRGVTHEMVRHREECSFAQESTRYCNYSLDKHCNEITFIEPCFWDYSPENGTTNSITCYNAWYDSCKFAEMQYLKILDNGGTPQQARGVLPSSTKADIVMTATLREWEHIFNLRACDSTGPAHPQIKEVMVPLLQDMQIQYQFAYGTMIPAELK